MDGWDVAIWSVAAYVAVLTLVRFMGARRKKMLEDLRQRAAAAQASRVTTADTAGEVGSK
jgi:uncharacterized membrane protein